MRFTGVVVSAIAGLLLLPQLANAQSKPLQLFTESFPPYNFLQDDKLQGINYEIVAAACELAEIECDFSLVHWNRAYTAALTQENTGVFTTARYPKREALFRWAGPLISSNACFYRLKTRTDIQVKNEQDLLNYTVGIPRGDIYQDVLNDLGMTEGEEYLTFSNKHEDSQMFAHQKLDLMIGSSLTLAYQLKRVGLSPQDVVPVLELNDDALGGNHLALNKSTDLEIVNALQRAMDEMLNNGTYANIIARYVSPPEQSTFASSSLKRCLNGSTNITPGVL